MSSYVHEESGNENKWSYGSSQWRNTTMASSIHTWYYYNYEITHRTNFSKMVIGKRKYISSIDPSISKLCKGESHSSRHFKWKKEFLFCAERWHFLTPQLLASLSSNWEVQLNCCSNARWCKNFEATILNSVWCTLFSAKRGNEKCWKWRNYFRNTNVL